MRKSKEAYQQFLLSPFWRDIRARKIALNPRCERCSSRQNLQCHHKFYRQRWEDTAVEDLETLCRSCHKKHHDLPKRISEMKARKPKKRGWSKSKIKRKRQEFMSRVGRYGYSWTA